MVFSRRFLLASMNVSTFPGSFYNSVLLTPQKCQPEELMNRQKTTLSFFPPRTIVFVKTPHCDTELQK